MSNSDDNLAKPSGMTAIQAEIRMKKREQGLRVWIAAGVVSLLAAGCAPDSANPTEIEEEPITADYERQSLSADGPNGERLVAGLYPEFEPIQSSGCWDNVSVGYGPEEIELSVTGVCNGGYRHNGRVNEGITPAWQSRVSGFMRMMQDSGLAESSRVEVEIAVKRAGFGSVRIERVTGSGRETLCDVELDFYEDGEASCGFEVSLREWYSIEIEHTELLPGSYERGTVQGGLDIQFGLNTPGLSLEYFTDFDRGGSAVEQLLTQRGCPELDEFEAPGPVTGQALLPHLAGSYFSYDAHACAARETHLAPICDGSGDLGFSFQPESTNPWYFGNIIRLMFDENPPSGDCAGTGENESWAAHFSGYMRLDDPDGSSEGSPVPLWLDGEVNDGLRFTVYNPTDAGTVLCTVDSMWVDVGVDGKWRSIGERPVNAYARHDCGDGADLEVGVNYPVEIDFFHNVTGAGSSYGDDARLDLWWSGLTAYNNENSENIRVGVYHTE